MSVRWALADQYQVPSESMYPQLHIGDHIGVNKMSYDLKLPFTNVVLKRMSEPQRGDVVVFIWPGDNSSTFVKRLVGVPGDHIQIENGFLTINGNKLETIDMGEVNTPQSYVEHIGSHQFTVQRVPWQMRGEHLDFIVPEEQYFFMGDNRDNSLDSRSWGFVKREAIKGKVLGVLWNIRFDNLVPEMDLSRVLFSEI